MRLFKPSTKYNRLVFEVPPDRIVYRGDFIWKGEGVVVPERDPVNLRPYVGERFVLAEPRLKR